MILNIILVVVDFIWFFAVASVWNSDLKNDEY